MRVVCAALSCFRSPSSGICSFVAFEFGDGVRVLPGSGVPSFRGNVLSERHRAFLVLVGGEFGHRLFPLFGSYMDGGRGAKLAPCFAKLSLGRGFVESFCSPRRKAIRPSGKRLAFIRLVARSVQFKNPGYKIWPLSLGGSSEAFLYAVQSVLGFLFPRGMREDQLGQNKDKIRCNGIDISPGLIS